MRPGFIMESGKNEWTAARPHRICGSSFNLTWVSAKIEGTQLVLAVKENVDGYVIEEKADDPQNLVAKKKGRSCALSHGTAFRRCSPVIHVKRETFL